MTTTRHTLRSLRIALTVVGYIAATLAANVTTSRYGLIPVGLGLTATAGTYFAGPAPKPGPPMTRHAAGSAGQIRTADVVTTRSAGRGGGPSLIGRTGLAGTHHHARGRTVPNR